MCIFNDVEKALKTDQTETAIVLGIAKSSYSQYKNGMRKTPVYIQYAMEVILMLGDAKRRQLRNKRLAP